MGHPCDAPKFNVQCVSIGHTQNKYDRLVSEIGHAVLHSWQYYIYRNDLGWIGIFTDSDLTDHFMHFAPQIQAVIKARSIAWHDFKTIFNKACNDLDFPKKIAWADGVEAPWQNGIYDKEAIGD
jgi:hypothetical protein